IHQCSRVRARSSSTSLFAWMAWEHLPKRSEIALKFRWAVKNSRCFRSNGFLSANSLPIAPKTDSQFPFCATRSLRRERCGDTRSDGRSVNHDELRGSGRCLPSRGERERSGRAVFHAFRGYNLQTFGDSSIEWSCHAHVKTTPNECQAEWL